MKRLLLLILITVTASARAGIDLTPTPSEYTAEGITFKQLSFRDGKRRVVYEPPRLWSYRGDASSLQLMPPNASRADASIQVAPLPKPQAFDETLFAALREQSLRGAPAGAQNVVLISEETNPLRIDQGEVYAVTISYQALGETFVRSAFYANLPDAQLTFRLTARKADFEALQRAFRSSILSWRWLENASDARVAQK